MKDSRNARTLNQALRGLAALLFLAAWCARAKAGIIYDTTPYWDGSTAIAGWGSVQSGPYAPTPTYGQTFNAPNVASSLESFTFYLTDFNSGDTLTYQADVYAWSGSLQGGNGPQGAVGSALYTSPDQVFVDNGNFQAVTINTGGVSLTPGGAYVVLLTTSDPRSIAENFSSQSLFEFGLTGYYDHQPNDGGGGFNFDDNASSLSLNTSPWDDYADYGDLAWTGVFQPQSVPEPGSLSLLGLGALGIILSEWRRRTTSHRRSVFPPRSSI